MYFKISIVCLSIFILVAILYLNHYYYLVYPSDKILSSYINKFRNQRLEEKGVLSDKQLSKEYVSKNFDYIKVAKTLFKTKNPEDLRKFEFPEKFVVKCSSGSQMNIIIKDEKYNLDKIIKRCKQFLKNKFSTSQYRFLPGFKEVHYDYNDPCIMVEEYLEDDIQDYKFSCVNGKIAFVAIDKDRFSGHKRNIYDQDMNLLNYKSMLYDNFDDEIKVKPDNLEMIKRFCNDFYQLSKFEFCRLDFYIIDDVVYFGEFTFTPENCSVKFSGDFDKMMYLNYVKT